ncbi:MAG: ImmA/IrrE family metallo-endopeptidase [Nitrosomonas sp.]|nr:ImmA/IrrE family metallo-endopeptidase [Nitrosomonas sp.]
MKSESVLGIQPELLRWARKTVGMSVTEVADSLKRKPEEIESWEAGHSAPTYPQLEKLAYQLYKRPLAVFFLPEPPEETTPQREFRTLPTADLQTLSRDTYLQIRRAHAYQIALKELFGGHNPASRCIWKSLSLSIRGDLAQQAQQIRQFFGVTLEEQIAWKSDTIALKQWRQAVEDCGVFVFKAAFKQKDISGFCLMDENLPIIYLNNSTTKTRQIFSLLHELAHLLLSINGFSKFDTDYIARLPESEKQLEIFCNAIAAEILIPGRDFAIQAERFPANIEAAPETLLSDLAGRYGVSREVILRRFLDLGRVSRVFYENKTMRWSAQKQPAGGGNWYLNQGAYLSDRFAKEVVSRHFRGQISLEQASDFLGIKPKSYAGFEERILQGSGA